MQAQTASLALGCGGDSDGAAALEIYDPPVPARTPTAAIALALQVDGVTWLMSNLSANEMPSDSHGD